MSTVTETPPKPKRTGHSHHDAPDTAADFEALAHMSEGPERNRLQQRVVAEWLPMAHRLAAKYRGRGEALEDLQQVAALALTKAVSRYDPERGYAFASFAVPTVTGELKRHFRDNMWDVHVPRHVQELRNRVRNSVRELSTSVTDRSPTEAEVAEHSGLSIADTRSGLEALYGFRSLSLEAEITSADDGYRLVDTLPAEEAGYDQVVDREAVRRPLRELPSREQRLLYMRFFRGMKQADIARELGISQMHVSRLLARTCDGIREEIENGQQPEEPTQSVEESREAAGSAA